MAKNKNRNHSQEQRDQRSGSAAESTEQAPMHMAKEPVISESMHSARKQQKKFGHN